MKTYTQAYAFIFTLVFIASLVENPRHASSGIVVLQSIIEALAVTGLAWFMMYAKRRFS